MKSVVCHLCTLAIFILAKSCFAQQFGKNNVQYSNFDWHYIQSRHFDIYFYPGSEGLVDFVADVAESSYVKISNNWNYTLKNRIVLILYKSHNDFGQTNLNLAPPDESVGGFTEFFKNRVVIPFEGSYEQLRHVTHHELTHAIMLQMLFGPKAQSILSGISRAHIPIWFIEGLAEFESRGCDSESEMFMRDAIVNGYLPPIHHLNAFLAYKGGQSVLYFLSQKYGQQKIGEILQNVRYAKNVERGLKQSVGMDIAELNEQWQKYLKKIYWPEFANHAAPNDFARQITFHIRERNFINNSGELSPQGDRIAYLSDRSGYFDIYIVSTFNGAQNMKLVSGQRSGRLEELHWLRPGLTWSPDGKKIAFAAKSGKQDALNVVDVKRKKIIHSYKFDLDGVYSPDWSPNGKKIAFMGTRDGQSDIYVYNLITNRLRHLTQDIFSDLEPKWSPDGKRLVFISDRSQHVDSEKIPDDYKIQNMDYHQFDIYLMDVESGRISRVTKTEANEKSPVWSPDGSRIAYVSDVSGISNIYIKKIDSEFGKSVFIPASMETNDNSTKSLDAQTYQEEAYPITNIVTGLDHLSWEGEKLAFTSFYNGGFDIYLITNPLKMTPVKNNPTLTHFISDTLKIKPKRNSPGNQISLEDDESGSNPANNPYRNFVFGEEFKKGQSLSEHQPAPEFFLNQSAYKAPAGKYYTKKYRTKFSADIMTGGAGYHPFFGFQGATILSFSDLLGNHRINILTDLFIDFQNSDMAINYYYLPRQTDYGFGIYRSNYLFFSQGRFLVHDRNLGFNISMTRPFDRFRRVEFALNIRHISREGLVDNGGDEILPASQSKSVFLTRVSYVKDNVIWGYTGPKAGSRYNLSVHASPDLGAGGLDFRIYQFDYRTYLNFKKDYTFALRLSAGLSEGRHKQKFFLGGLDNWINLDFRDDVFIELDDIYFSNFITPLRGFSYYEQVGSKYFLANFELRVPFVNYFDMSWPLPVNFSKIRGTLFLDIGSAWDHNFNFLTKTDNGKIMLDDVLMSFGWGMRVNVGFFLLKFDMAWQSDLTGISRAHHLFSIGTDF